MSTYTPDCWEVIIFKSEEYGDIEKVFAGWYGGWAGSDSWKLNSGIKSHKVVGDFIEFTGPTGSVYCCHKNSRKMSGYMSQIYSGFERDLAAAGLGTIEISNKEFV
jgi:hypothetical protein